MFTKHQLLYRIMLMTVERYFFIADFFSINYYFVHHVLPFYIFILQEFRAMFGDFVARFSTYARGLPRSLSDHGSGTSSPAPRPVLGDCLDHSPTTARGLRRSPLNLSSGTASITLRPQLVDSAACSSTYVRGLPRPLSDHSSGTLRLNYMRLATRIQLGYSNSTSQNRPPFLPGFSEQALSLVPPNACMGSALYATGDRQVPPV